MSLTKHPRGSITSFLVNLWTITTLVLALSGAAHIPWYVILGPYMLLIGMGLLGFIVLGIASTVEKD